MIFLFKCITNTYFGALPTLVFVFFLIVTLEKLLDIKVKSSEVPSVEESSTNKISQFTTSFSISIHKLATFNFSLNVGINMRVLFFI